MIKVKTKGKVKLEKVRCNLCNSDSTSFLYKNGGFSLVRCNRCCLVYVNPRPTLKSLNEFYHGYFADVKDPDGKTRNYFRERKEKTKEFRKDVKKILKFKRKGKILDVGCAAGFFLDAMGGKWDRYGVEFSKRAADFARKEIGVKVKVGSLIDAKFPDKFFDVVYMSHVIEHMQDPLSNLREVSRILKDDGIFMFATPNFNSFCSRVFRTRHRLICAPAHLYFFTKHTLRKMLAKAGMRIIKVSYPYFDSPYFNAREIRNLIVRLFLLWIYIPLLDTLQIKHKEFNIVSAPMYGNVIELFARKK